MSAIGQPNLRRWSGGWDGALRKPESCFAKEGFKLAAKIGCGRTVSNVQGKGIPNDGSSYGKTARPKTCADSFFSSVCLTMSVCLPACVRFVIGVCDSNHDSNSCISRSQVA